MCLENVLNHFERIIYIQFKFMELKCKSMALKQYQGQMFDSQNIEKNVECKLLGQKVSLNCVNINLMYVFNAFRIL